MMFTAAMVALWLGSRGAGGRWMATTTAARRRRDD
jgi:hypothetical protein